MPFTDIAVYFVIAILGLAYPISLQVLTRLDEKYGSVNILKRFEKEFWGKVFTFSLYGSIAAVLLHILWKITLKPECKADTLCYFWPDFILLLVVSLLVFSFLFYIKKIFVYYSPYRLVDYLKSREDDDQHSGFNSLADIFYLSIRLEDATLSQTLHNYFYQRFRDLRVSAGKNELTYPIAFYQMGYNALIEAGEKNSKKGKNLALNIASGRYYIGEHQYTRLSELTFSWLWNNLKFITEVKDDDFAFEFWSNSHQFFSSSIPQIKFKTNREDPLEILNRKEVDQRASERDKFYGFHFALGGMLLYGQRYKLLNRIFRHTMSIPPSYELLPSTMTTVFVLFVRFRDPDYRMIPYPYHFYQTEGIAGEGLSKSWICKYIALTLLRQYTITSYYYGQNPVTLPFFPSSRVEKQHWLDATEYLKSCIKDLQGEKELMDATGFSIITDSWCLAKRILPPVQLVDEVAKKLQMLLAAQEVEQELSKDKVNQFYEKSATITKAIIDSFSPLLSQEIPKKRYEIVQITGALDLIKKEAFAEDQGVTYLDYDSRLAKKLGSKITTALSDGFHATLKISYLFKAPELFEAISKLKPNKGKYVLLNFGVHIPTAMQNHQIEGLHPTTYKGITIMPVPSFDRHTLDSSLILLKKEDLPALRLAAPEQSEIERFSLQDIGMDIPLFGKVIDLNEQPQFKEFFGNISEETLDISVLMKLAINLEILWSKNITGVEFKLYSEFYQNGIPNKLSELKKLNAK